MKGFPSYYLYLLLESLRRHHLEDEDLQCHLLAACLAGESRDDGFRGPFRPRHDRDIRVELFKILRLEIICTTYRYYIQ